MHPLIWECVTRWAVVAAMCYHQFGSANGISTLALPRVPCRMPYRAFYKFVLYHTYGVPSDSPPVYKGIMVLYRLWEYIKCVKGDMGNALTLF